MKKELMAIINWRGQAIVAKYSRTMWGVCPASKEYHLFEKASGGWRCDHCKRIFKEEEIVNETIRLLSDDNVILLYCPNCHEPTIHEPAFLPHFYTCRRCCNLIHERNIQSQMWLTIPP